MGNEMGNEIRVVQLGGNIGARIDGVRVSGDLDAATVEVIHRAWLKHKVVFFRGQDHLDDNTQMAFADLLGTRTAAHPGMLDLDVSPIDSADGTRANAWHTDVTFCDRPPKASLLRALALPPYGGDTCWANTVTAYEQLPDALRVLADQLWVQHTSQFDYLAGVAQPSRAEYFNTLGFVTEHPLVRVHPETGERSLLLGAFARHIVGMMAADSAALIRVFQDHITRLENTLRWSWQPGDMAMWDNRATQHYAIADYDEHHRLMHRVTLAGDVPTSIAGEASRVISGDASAYSPAITPPLQPVSA
ncbi:taurine dioxygenase [Mycobacteroides abscessus subsp. massiliense]|nr:taurine dioxygenase [Mycobacteroides abscessus subsp. massiliense]SKH92896.1 taurine dioxygenase [Mycobacteroides abscessus subsp. massiliense]SKI13252.1 taurine dioxygenase [Mycobacteroides abscessus subsp. massiliense]SKJ99055.1 taurine dioxygenase [Mycobacteroides abscessus subsp. massiliense]SKK28414.1 taurine dioxygenase [Mycobacteroides abscessus subsp. massiliense]